ncbi:MAG: hypothetical protein GX951_00140 [Mollicutes bacterium]|nr:hypothetical protein [Mollicutes bacterium]
MSEKSTIKIEDARREGVFERLRESRRKLLLRNYYLKDEYDNFFSSYVLGDLFCGIIDYSCHKDGLIKITPEGNLHLIDSLAKPNALGIGTIPEFEYYIYDYDTARSDVLETHWLFQVINDSSSVIVRRTTYYYCHECEPAIIYTEETGEFKPVNMYNIQWFSYHLVEDNKYNESLQDILKDYEQQGKLLITRDVSKIKGEYNNAEIIERFGTDLNDGYDLSKYLSSYSRERRK